MRVSKFSLKNVLGLRELDYDCHGAITVIKGRNGSGKTSALAGLRTMIGGGNLATLRSVDAPEDEQAEGVLVLDGDKGQLIIEKKGAKLSIKKQVGDTAAFETVPAPQRFLDRLFDAPAANPVQFLTCKDKDRIQLLLEALVLDHDSADMWRAIGLEPSKFPPVPAGLHPLREIAHVKEVVFDARTGVNTNEKAKRATAEQIRRKIPAVVPTVVDLSEKEARLSELKETLASRRVEIMAERDASIQKIEAETSLIGSNAAAEYAAEESRLRVELAEKLAELKAALHASLDAQNIRAEEQFGIARREAELKQQEAEAVIPVIEALTVEIAISREQAKDAVRIQTLREQANTQESEAEDLKAYAMHLTAALKALERYKAELCANLPIQGLDFTGGEVRVNGVPWETLNTAQKIRIAVQVSCLRFGDDFRPIFVDGAEAVDAEQFELLETELEVAGTQAFVARVADTDLEVMSK